MRLRLGLFALISVVVGLAAFGLSSFVVDPENIGVRLALYALVLLATVATILFVVFALVSPMFGRAGVSATQIVDAPQVVVTAGPASTPQDAAVPQDAPARPGQ